MTSAGRRGKDRLGKRLRSPSLGTWVPPAVDSPALCSPLRAAGCLRTILLDVSSVTFWTFSFRKVNMKGLRDGVTRAVIRATTLLSCVEGPLSGF